MEGGPWREEGGEREGETGCIRLVQRRERKKDEGISKETQDKKREGRMKKEKIRSESNF